MGLDTFRTSFQIAGLKIQLLTGHPITVDPNFSIFAADDEKPDFLVDFQETEAIPVPHSDPIASNYWCDVYRTEAGSVRMYRTRSDPGRYYAFGIQTPGDSCLRIGYLPERKRYFLTANGCFIHIPLDEVLMGFDRMILHASFVTSRFGGILFSGPSGIGKSTQGELWKKLEGSRVINGDRPILGRQDGKWLAYGAPYAGSSRYYVNESAEVAAIVMLGQGKECAIRRLSQTESFRSLYAATALNPRNEAFMHRACDLLEQLSAEVPVYHLVCTPDSRAVETLKARLAVEERQ